MYQYEPPRKIFEVITSLCTEVT